MAVLNIKGMKTEV